VVWKATNEVYLVDVAIPDESREITYFTKKYWETKYVDFKIEVSRLWKTKKVFVIPIIIGAMESIPIDFSGDLILSLPLYIPDLNFSIYCFNIKTIFKHLTAVDIFFVILSCVLGISYQYNIVAMYFYWENMK